MTRSLKSMVKSAKDGSDPLSPLIDEYFLTRPGRHKLYVPSPDVDADFRSGRFSPSSSGDSKCIRAAAFQFVATSKKVKRDPEKELIFATGDALHLMWYGIFLDMQKVLGKERFEVVKIEGWVSLPELFFGGRFDILVRINGKLYIVDFKSINDAGFTRVMHGRGPNLDNRDQLIRYMRLKKVPLGILMYLNKNDSRWKVFVVEYRDHKDVWIKTVGWVKRAIGYLERQEVPPKHSECERDSSMARQCPFSYLCYAKKSKEDLHKLMYGGKGYQEFWGEADAKAQAGKE